MHYPPNSDVDRIFAPWDKPDSPGFAIAVSQAGRPVYSRGYGMADLDHDIKITPTTVFHAASLSKQFTAMCVMLLVQQDRLSLADHVHKIVPELPRFKPPITIADLLHHTSGLRDQWVLATLAGWRMSDDVITEQDVVEDLVPRMKSLNFSPGSDYSYSNTNYTLAGKIVERVSGLTLAAFAHKHIFDPLGMKNTLISDSHARIVKNRAYGYHIANRHTDGHHDAGPHFEIRMPNYDLTGPTNLQTTVEDLLLWDHNFDLKTVGGATALKAMQTKAKNSEDYGLGLHILKQGGHRIVEHDGRDAGYRSHLIRYPDQQFCVALLCNLALPEDLWTGTLVRQVAAVYLGGSAAAARASAQPTSLGARRHRAAPEHLADYLGRYLSDEVGATYDIVRTESSIAIIRRKYDPAVLAPASTDTFTAQNFSAVLSAVSVHFRRDAKGKVDGFDISDLSGADRLRHLRFAKLARE